MLGAYIYGRIDGVDMGFKVFANFDLKTQKSLFLRSLYGYGAIVAAMIAISITPVSIAVSIMMTQVFVSTLTGFFLAGERISVYEMISIIGGFFGVILLVNDQLFANKTDLV